MSIIILGPSGSGKGTLAEWIIREFGFKHFSSGAIFREHIANKTPLGIEVKALIEGGVWVCDELTMQMVFESMRKVDTSKGFILDGVPRTMKQVEILEQEFKIDLVIELDIDDKAVIKRLSGRWVCPKCEASYNVRFGAVDQCAKCQSALYQREDDKEEAITRRLAQYRAPQKEITQFYRTRGVLETVDIGEDTPAEVYAKIRPIIEKVLKAKKLV